MLCNVDCNKNVRSAIGIVFFLFANVVGLHWFCKISNPASAKIILIFGNDLCLHFGLGTLKIALSKI